MSEKIQCCECEQLFDEEDLIIGERDDLLWCPECARRNLKECAYCESLRWPENLFEYENPDGKKSKWNRKLMCAGCLDGAYDEDCGENHKED